MLALVAIFCGAQAGRNVPAKWTDLQSFELVPLTAVELIQERTGSFATTPVSHGEVLLLALETPTPPALSSALIPLSTNWALPIHADLKLGFSRIRALNHNSATWTVSLFDKQVVHIASADGELLRYREFQDAWQHRRWRMVAFAGASGLAAALLALFSRRLLAALAARAGRSQASPLLKSL
ncbi:hypothetical protein [Roseateles sp. P5_E7]